MPRRKFAGPKVDIYVGSESKHFHLPKDILCYYSTYFDRCFNGGFKEAKELKLTLPEDQVEYFQHLLDYMFMNGGESFKAHGTWKQKMDYYMTFIEYIGKYELFGAFQMISGGLKEVMMEAFQLDHPTTCLLPQHIETVFRVLPDGHELRGSVAVLALKYGFMRGSYTTQERTVDGFAVELLNQMRKHNDSSNYSTRSTMSLTPFFKELYHTFAN